MHLDPQAAVFTGMLEGWASQQRSRLLGDATVAHRLRVVRRFGEFTNDYPWAWQPADVEEFSGSLRGRGLAFSTIRMYQQALALFCEFVTDPRYGWAVECERRFGSHAVQVCTEANTAAHVAEFEGDPRRRPFSREELQAFFDYADAQVRWISRSGRKGALAAFRDAVCFKVIYAWGLRRMESVMLDTGDWHPSPAAPQFGNLGAAHVRYGKAMRGSAPRRRTVLSVFGWAVEAVEQYFAEVRPLLEPGDHPAMWVSERRGRLAPRALNDRFAAYRAGLGLPEVLDLHALRHSYVTHLVEDGFPERFVSEQVGHRYASTTAIYTSVSDDFKNRVLARALEPVFGATGTSGGTVRLRAGWGSAGICGS
jgi:integrase/recombinase XerC